MENGSAFNFYGREREIGQIDAFLRARGAGFTHLRGRRRIGKTELLKKVARDRDGCFYFMGRGDEESRKTLKRFAAQWDMFTGEPRLSRLRVSELSWDEAFREVGRFAANRKKRAPFVLLLDEIQWLANKGAGFCGLIKEHWAEWKKLGRFKLIISGSSNRFFHTYTDGEMAILRGLRTHATIWVKPFTLAEVKKYYFPRWTDEEICLVYMMFGGVPYYLENIDDDGNFIRAINRSVFCRGGIFLEEVDALLRLETTAVGARKRVKELLSTLGQDGATEATIAKRSGFAQDYVHKTLQRLIDYDIVHERWPLGARRNNRSGVRFFMADFYLNFYFQILKRFESKIKGNTRGMLFPAEVVGSKGGYYIPDFTGKAFELLISDIVEQGRDDESLRTQKIFDKLALQTGRYECGTYWIPDRTQIDLVLAGLDDREIRIVEAKWISKKGEVATSREFIEQLLAKRYEASQRRSWRRSHHLVLSADTTPALEDVAARRRVGIIALQDLF